MLRLYIRNTLGVALHTQYKTRMVATTAREGEAKQRPHKTTQQHWVCYFIIYISWVTTVWAVGCPDHNLVELINGSA